jgi:hypothetical protein
MTPAIAHPLHDLSSDDATGAASQPAARVDVERVIGFAHVPVMHSRGDRDEPIALPTQSIYAPAQEKMKA